jgi:glutamate 5-kinase
MLGRLGLAETRPTRTPVTPAADILAAARRIVVKVGSSLLVESGAGVANRAWLAALAQDLAGLRGGGRQALIVSSGAVALGRRRLGLTASSRRLDEKQAAAAAGQSLLMRAWEEAFEPHGVAPAQILLTRDDTEQRNRWLNARATLEALLSLGALPVINENDTVATEEIRYGDNDRLAARAAQLVRADLLVLLSDVDGLYTADPRRDPDARHIPWVDDLGADVLAMASGANAEAGVGTGGMTTKLEAARIARAAGCVTLIAQGTGLHPLAALAAGARATVITAPATPATAYKQWIAGSLSHRGAVVVDAGAASALTRGKSLLPSGVTACEGDFRKGDCILVRDGGGGALAVGVTAYDCGEVERIRGRRSAEIEAVLGYRGPAEVIHRDDLAALG